MAFRGHDTLSKIKVGITEIREYGAVHFSWKYGKSKSYGEYEENLGLTQIS